MGLLQQGMRQEVVDRPVENGVSIDALVQQSGQPEAEVQEGDEMSPLSSVAPAADGQNLNYERLVLMAIEHLTGQEMFMAMLQQAQQGDVGQVVGGAVVQTLLGLQGSAAQAGVQIDNRMLSAASVDVTKQIVGLFAAMGATQDPQQAFRDAIEYGKTLVQGGGQASPPPASGLMPQGVVMDEGMSE